MLPAGTDLLLAIDGREEPMGAKAQLNVLEGTPTVHLLITGADGAQDLVILDLEFDGVESSLGPHQGTVGLPDTGYTVSASLAGRPYHSQAGYIDLSLAEDGSIQGTFNADLAEDPAVASDQPLEILPSDQVLGLSGQFMGQWVLRCQSRLPGHRSFILGGDYCESLEF